MAALEIVSLDTTTPQLRAPSAADTYTAPRAMDITPVALTGSAATSSLSIAQTWNTTGAPTALDLNVTDTASNAASLLMNLRVGGTSLFRVGKAGNAIAPISSAATPAYAMGANATGIYSRSATLRLNFSVGGNDAGVEVGSGLVALASTSQLAWVATTLPSSSPDLILARDTANTLAQRNGVNAQEKRVYGTFTDASNHRRVAMGMSASGVGFVRPEGAGTGATGNVLHISGLPTSNPGPGILWNNAGTVAIGT